MTVVLYSHSSRLGGAELAAPGLAAQIGAELWSRAEAHREEASRRDLAFRVLPPTWDRRPRGPVELVKAVIAIVRAQRQLVRSLRRARPDLVVANNVQGALHLVTGCLVSRTPLVVYVRDLGDGGNRPAAEVAGYRFLLDRVARGCVFNSDLTRRSWRLRSDLPTLVVPTAVPDAFFDLPRRPRPDEVVMLGRIATWKGQAQVVRAVERLRGRVPARLRLVGGALFGDRAELPEHTVPVEVTGHRERPWEELETAAVLVHASLTPEPFGQVLAQAAAAGVPVVCSDRGGQTEWLEHGVSCVVADPHDVQVLADAIADVLSDPESAARRARVARERAEAFREAVAYGSLRVWLTQLVGPRGVPS